jgi:hypothetical protein
MPLLERLRAMAWRGLARMYQPEARLFVFRHRRGPDGTIRAEGLSRRYTAIVLIGLAEEDPDRAAEVLAGHDPREVCGWLAAEAERIDNLGDAALCLWAAARLGYPHREPLRQRFMSLGPLALPQPTVELAWALDAVLSDAHDESATLAPALATRLLKAFSPRGRLFPHHVGVTGGWRAHVACFADQVYPIHALANYARRGWPEADRALETAAQVAEQICARQGPAGQWWWHYDCRTGDVIEGYPVYAVHQDAMAPMALLALAEAGGPFLSDALARGLDWLVASPELDGGSLVDTEADLIWRKVARREPAKVVRAAQAFASRLHPRLRLPAADRLFPPRVVDEEDRPYHLGWLLYTWSRERLRGAAAPPSEPAA